VYQQHQQLLHPQHIQQSYTGGTYSLLPMGVYCAADAQFLTDVALLAAQYLGAERRVYSDQTVRHPSSEVRELVAVDQQSVQRTAPFEIQPVLLAPPKRQGPRQQQDSKPIQKHPSQDSLSVLALVSGHAGTSSDMGRGDEPAPSPAPATAAPPSTSGRGPTDVRVLKAAKLVV
jgi:hypothetical protein